MFLAEDPRREHSGVRFWKPLDVLTTLNLAFILGVVIYLLVAYGWKFLQWLELNGP